MPIATAAGRQNAAAGYTAAATACGLQTTAAAGTAGTEVTGAGYARQALTWTGSNGVLTASATFTVPAGVTVQSAFLTTSTTVGSGTFLDSVAVSYASQGSAGTLTVNLTFTES